MEKLHTPVFMPHHHPIVQPQQRIGKSLQQEIVLLIGLGRPHLIQQQLPLVHYHFHGQLAN